MQKTLKIKKKKPHYFLILAVVCLVAYLLFLILDAQINAGQKKTEVTALEEQVALLESEINEATRLLSSETEEEYMERIAREQLGYAAAGERVYVDVNAEDTGE